MSLAHPQCHGSMRPPACSGGSSVGGPERPSLPEPERGRPPCHPDPSSTPGGAVPALLPSLHRRSEGQWCHPSRNYRLVFFPKQEIGVCSAPCDAAVCPARAHTCTHLHTPAHPCPRPPNKPGPLALLSVPCLGPGACSYIPFPSNSHCPQSVKCPPGTSRPFSALPFWVFQEDEEENTSVNSMFLGCLIKRDKIAEELRAGLAGVGSHALLPHAAASG